MSVFLQVAVYHCPNYAVVGFSSVPNRRRFEEKQDPLGGVLVGVVLSAYLMNDVWLNAMFPNVPVGPGSAKPFSLNTLWMSWVIWRWVDLAPPSMR